RLLAIAAPSLPPPRSNQPARRDRTLDALQEAARDRLAQAAENRRVRLHGERPAEDRHGRRLAQAVTEDGLWLQAHLLEAGLARVETTAEAARYASQLLTIENEARRARRGIWGYAAFAAIGPREAGRRLDSFQLVEGIAEAIDGRRPATRFALARDG